MELAAYEGGTEAVVHDGIALHCGCGVVLLASSTLVTSVAPFPTMRTFGTCSVNVALHPTFVTFMFPGWAFVSSGSNCVRAVGCTETCPASLSRSSGWSIILSHAPCNFTAYFALLLFGLLLSCDVLNYFEQ